MKVADYTIIDNKPFFFLENENKGLTAEQVVVLIKWGQIENISMEQFVNKFLPSNKAA